MRVSYRLPLVTCLLLWAVIGREGVAQGPPPGPGYRPGYPPTPSTMMSYPGNSIYDSQFSKHYIQDGLWHRIAPESGRRKFFNFDVLYARTREPRGLVGNRNALSYKDLILPILEEDPYDLGDSGGGGGNQQQSVIDQFRGQPEAGIKGFNYYDAVTLQNVMEAPNGTGLRLQIGYFEPDESGLVVEGFGHSLDSNFNARNDLGPGRGDQKSTLLQLLSPPDFLSNDLGADDPDEILQNNLLNLRGLPLDDGSTFGLTSPFDLEYRLSAESDTYGLAATWVMAPTYRRKSVMIRPLFGIRYLRVHERFGFFGQDSGLSYDNIEDLDDPFNGDVKVHSPPDGFDNDSDGIVDNAAMVEESGNQGGGGGGGDDEEFRFILYNDPMVYPITSFLRNYTRSDMVGPEIGLRYDLGGKKFKLWGQTKFGVLANNERTRMSGDNIGMVTRQNNFNLPTPENNRPNRFTDRQNHSHVSPIVEQSFFAEFPIFGKLPVLKRVRILKNAKFRFGYTLLSVWEVARPYESINWQGHPVEGLYPSINVDRSRWWSTNLSYSINWAY